MHRSTVHLKCLRTVPLVGFDSPRHKCYCINQLALCNLRGGGESEREKHFTTNSVLVLSIIN
jgi:hypothetical protein